MQKELFFYFEIAYYFWKLLLTTDIGTKVMSFEELSVEVVDSMSIPSMTRATSRIEWNISPDTVMKADTAYSLEADEIVTINCTYSPRTANLDFGFITQDDTFHFNQLNYACSERSVFS